MLSVVAATRTTMNGTDRPPVTGAGPQPSETRGVPTGRPRGGGGMLNVLLLAATFVTLTLGGALSEAGRHGVSIQALGDLFRMDLLALGLPYSLGLLVILGAHEMGHYIACRRYGVDASLPYFLPGHPLAYGTFGAFIRIRSPIPSRKALFDIGIAGPIAGFVVLLPLLFYGLATAQPIPRDDSMIFVGKPLLYMGVRAWLPLGIGPDETIYLTGPLKAAWVGCLATAMNLFPIGQLDGGHVCYAISRRFHRVASLIGIAAFTGLGLLIFPAWLFLATLLILVGPAHPPVIDEMSPLSRGRRIVAILGLLLLVVCFIARPFPL